MAASVLIGFFYNLTLFGVYTDDHTPLRIALCLSMIAAYGYFGYCLYRAVRQSNLLRKIAYVNSRLVEYIVLIFLCLFPFTAVLNFILTFNEEETGLFGNNFEYNSYFVYRDAAMIAIITVIRNVRVREEVKSLAAQLKQHQQMTRSISHEIRTPLNTALMAVELLLDGLKR